MVTVTLMDATYKTTKYSIPLFFVCPTLQCRFRAHLIYGYQISGCLLRANSSCSPSWEPPWMASDRSHTPAVWQAGAPSISMLPLRIYSARCLLRSLTPEQRVSNWIYLASLSTSLRESRPRPYRFCLRLLKVPRHPFTMGTVTTLHGGCWVARSASNTCQPSDVLVLQAAAPMPLHPPGSRFFIHPSGTEWGPVSYQRVACRSEPQSQLLS